MTIQCCVCCAVEDGGVWRPYPRKISGASHTYCPTCYNRQMRALDDYRKWRL